MTTHSISILLQIKMSYFGRTQARRRALHWSIAPLTPLCWRPCQMSNSSSSSWTRDWYTRRWTRQ